MRISMDTIENYLYLFDNQNSDFVNLRWVEPICVAMIRAYQNDEKLAITTNNEYIRTMILSDYKSNKSYSPIETVHSRNGLEKISSHLAQIMLKNFTTLQYEDQKNLINYLQYLFLELMNNVSDHAESPVVGYVMAQYFPNKKKIQFVVADRGIGFLENIQLKFPDITDENEAIRKALKKKGHLYQAQNVRS